VLLQHAAQLRVVRLREVDAGMLADERVVILAGKRRANDSVVP